MALRLLRECHEARLERAARVHHADKAAQHKDEHHDVGGLHRARHHAHRDVGDAFGLLLQALVRVGNRDGLGQRAVQSTMAPHAIAGQRLPFFPERNFAENALVLCCGFAACTSAWRSLSLRRTEPPTQGGASLETFIDQNLAAYAAARQLSKREAEVLRLVLLGKDNQNIATSMHLAPSTVKVHMHHILQKAERANRKELIQDFWEFS